MYEYKFVMPREEFFGQGMIGFGMVAAVILILTLLAIAFAVVSYVLGAVGMYRIAKRRGIHHAWLAWVPVGSSWLLGSISDHYQYVVKGKNTKRRKVLLILSLILSAVSVLLSGTVVFANIAGIGTNAAAVGNRFALTIGLLILYYWVLFGLSIAATVIAYIAYYDLFQSSKPNHAVLFLVLSVSFHVTLPFFVFACGGSDKGMPERRAPRPQVQAAYEPKAPEEEIPVVEAEPVDDPAEE